MAIIKPTACLSAVKAVHGWLQAKKCVLELNGF